MKTLLVYVTFLNRGSLGIIFNFIIQGALKFKIQKLLNQNKDKVK